MTISCKLRSIPTVFAVLALIVTVGCGEVDYRPAAQGEEGVVTVVTDSSTWTGAPGETLRREVGPYIQTLPQAERAFQFRQIELESNDALDRAKKMKNVIFIAPLNGTSNTATFIRSRLDSAVTARVQKGELNVFYRGDQWYRKQMVVYITAATERGLVDALEKRGDELRSRFDEITRERMIDEMFEKGRQRDLEEQLMQNHGFAVNVQHDYVIIQDTTNFVRMRRVLPDTWRDVFIYYVENADPAILDPSWIYNTRDSLSKIFQRGTIEGSYVQIDRRRPLITNNINFLGRYGFRTRGLWRMTGDAMGGPFLNYTFYDETQNRIYMIDGMVFAPNYNKLGFVRQIEAIAHTFRTRPEVQKEQEQVASK